VSVVFVDLVNYTAWSESQDAENVRELLSGYFEVARTVIGRYGGVVEKFIGDAVMAVWGAPQAHEDDAERAVRASLEIVAAVAEFGQRRGLADLRARAGVVTGQVATWASPGEGLVTGDRVNSAARVQSVAEPGAVLVDAETRAATQDAVAYGPPGEHQVKGKAEPLLLSCALRVVGGVGGVQRVDGLEAGFIGRGRELALVKELFHASQESGRARLVSVTGAAGIGKSRLAWEFEKYVDGLVVTVWWHRGRCLPYGDGVAFWALAEMVRQRFGIAEEDSSEAAAAKLDAKLPVWVPDPDERDFVRPRLAILIGAAEAAEISREELFAGWRLFLERLAAAGPIVVVIEDLQWADSGLLDFLDHLLDWSAESSIFMLTLARSELAERRPGWLADRRNATTMHLEPLAEPELDQLLEALVPGMPEHAKAQIAAQAAGVPLYAVETIRSLVDRDVVVPEEGVYRLVADPGELAVPGTLTSLLAARLDGLPASERELVKGLAVLGSSFPRPAVAAVTDAPAEQIDEWLRQLVGKEILTRRLDPLSPERGQYMFVQTMLRSVAHDTLTKRERKSRHLAVATHLRATFPNDGEEIAEVIAAHYHDAYTAGQADADADAVRANAVEAFERAGRRAGAVGAPDAAERAYRTAAGLATTEPDVTRFTEEAAHMASMAGRFDDALTLYQSATAAHTQAGRMHEVARRATNIAQCLANLGRGQEGFQLLRDALSLLEASATNPVVAELHGGLGRLLFMSGELDATPHIEQALAMSSALELPDVLSRALDSKAMLLRAESRMVEAVAIESAAIDVSRRHGLTVLEATAHHNLGDSMMQDDVSGASAEFKATVKLSGRLGDRPGQSLALGNIALLRYFQGEWDAANSAARAAIDAAPNENLKGIAHLPLVLLAAARGDADGAERYLARLAVLDTSDDPQDRAGAGVARAAAALVRGRHEAAQESAGATARAAAKFASFRSDGFRLGWPLALRAALESGDVETAESLLGLVDGVPVGHVPPYLRAELAHFRALTHAAAGNHDTVEADLHQAMSLLSDLGYPYWLALTQIDLARWLIDRGRAAEVGSLVTDAVETFTRLGAQPALDATARLLQNHSDGFETSQSIAGLAST